MSSPRRARRRRARTERSVQRRAALTGSQSLAPGLRERTGLGLEESPRRPRARLRCRCPGVRRRASRDVGAGRRMRSGEDVQMHHEAESPPFARARRARRGGRPEADRRAGTVQCVGRLYKIQSRGGLSRWAPRPASWRERRRPRAQPSGRPRHRPRRWRSTNAWSNAAYPLPARALSSGRPGEEGAASRVDRGILQWSSGNHVEWQSLAPCAHECH
jgi:hypothetical protein